MTQKTLEVNELNKTNYELPQDHCLILQNPLQDLPEVLSTSSLHVFHFWPSETVHGKIFQEKCCRKQEARKYIEFSHCLNSRITFLEF